MRATKLSALIYVTAGFPILAWAQATDLSGLISIFIKLISQVTILAAAVALLAFFWGLIKFIFYAGSAEGREEGKKVMLWGIVALFVLLSIWGIIALAQNTFFAPGTSPSGPQQFQTNPNPFSTTPT